MLPCKLLETLPNDEAVVTSDYKMKILSCYSRKNQKKRERHPVSEANEYANDRLYWEERREGLKDEKRKSGWEGC